MVTDGPIHSDPQALAKATAELESIHVRSMLGIVVLFVAQCLLMLVLSRTLRIQLSRAATLLFFVIPMAFYGVLIVTWSWRAVRRLRKQVDEELAARELMSDADFLAAVGATPAQATACLAACDAFAAVANVEPGRLRPTDLAEWLSQHLSLPLDTIEITLEAEKRLGVKIRGGLEGELLCGTSGPARRRDKIRGFRLLTVGRFAIDLARAVEAGRCPPKE